MTADSHHNVFADLGVPQPEEALFKARLASHIYDVVTGRDLSDADAGALLGLTPTQLQDVLDGALRSFSVPDLLGLVLKVDGQLTVQLPRPDGQIDTLMYTR